MGLALTWYDIDWNTAKESAEDDADLFLDSLAEGDAGQSWDSLMEKEEIDHHSLWYVIFDLGDELRDNAPELLDEMSAKHPALFGTGLLSCWEEMPNEFGLDPERVAAAYSPETTRSIAAALSSIDRKLLEARLQEAGEDFEDGTFVMLKLLDVLAKGFSQASERGRGVIVLGA